MVDDEEGAVHSALRDRRQFGLLYQRYVDPVYRYVLARTQDVRVAEDLTAQTFLTALERLHQYRFDGPFPAWLFAIARRKSADHWRRVQVRPEQALDETLAATDEPFLHLDQHPTSQRLRQIVAALPADDRELLHLRFVSDLRYPAIARVLGKNEEAVKKSLYRLLDRIEAALTEVPDAP